MTDAVPPRDTRDGCDVSQRHDASAGGDEGDRRQVLRPGKACAVQLHDNVSRAVPLEQLRDGLSLGRRFHGAERIERRDAGGSNGVGPESHEDFRCDRRRAGLHVGGARHALERHCDRRRAHVEAVQVVAEQLDHQRCRAA